MVGDVRGRFNPRGGGGEGLPDKAAPGAALPGFRRVAVQTFLAAFPAGRRRFAARRSGIPGRLRHGDHLQHAQSFSRISGPAGVIHPPI